MPYCICATCTHRILSAESAANYHMGDTNRIIRPSQYGTRRIPIDRHIYSMQLARVWSFAQLINENYIICATFFSISIANYKILSRKWSMQIKIATTTNRIDQHNRMESLNVCRWGIWEFKESKSICGRIQKSSLLFLWNQGFPSTSLCGWSINICFTIN